MSGYVVADSEALVIEKYKKGYDCQNSYNQEVFQRPAILIKNWGI